MAAKFEIAKFNGQSSSFSLWRVKMKDLLVQQGLHKTLHGQEKFGISAENWEDMDAKALSSIQLSLADDVLREVEEETSAAGI
jgi:hypothetical protein